MTRTKMLIAVGALFAIMAVLMFPGMPKIASWALVVGVVFPGMMWWLWYSTQEPSQ